MNIICSSNSFVDIMLLISVENIAQFVGISTLYAFVFEWLLNLLIYAYRLIGENNTKT